MEGLFLHPVLALNTATHQEEVVLLNDNKVVAKKRWKSVRNESSMLLKSVDSVFKKASVSFKDLSGILCIAGPGPFSAVRIGCAVANAIAFSSKIPVYGVTVEALWKTRKDSFIKKRRLSPNTKAVFVVISAGKGHYALLDLDSPQAFTPEVPHPIHSTYGLAEICALLVQKSQENGDSQRSAVLCDTTASEAEILKNALPAHFECYTEADTKAILPFGKTLLALAPQLIYTPNDTIVTPRYLKPPTISESKNPLYAS